MPEPAESLEAIAAILRRFRSQRPIRGGSLLVTIFGDAVAPRGGVATLGSLIQLAAPFGLTERHVRTAIGRLAQDGWLVARRDGRRSEYRLTRSGQQRFAEATQRIYGRNPATWDGQWTLLMLSPGAGKRRDELREELRWLGFGQVSPGVFANPSGELELVRERLRELDLAQVILLRSTSEGLEADRRLVGAGWDLGELARRYRRFVDTFKQLATTQSGRLSAQAAFVIRTLLVHEYRKIHLQDPLLPPALLPADWIGTTAYELCASLYGRVFPQAEVFLSNTASTLREPLPAARPETYDRFGGLHIRAG